MADSAILRFNRTLLFELETDGTPEGSIVTAPYSGTIPGGGTVLSFDSNVETPIPLIIDIKPLQEGTGDPSPSNVRPISGYTDVNVNVAGGNIFDKNLYPFLQDESNNGWYISGTRLQKGESSNATIGMPCKPNTGYRITVNIGYPLLQIAYGKMADLSFQTGSTTQTVYNTQTDTTTIGYREVIYQTEADATFLFIQFPDGYHEEGANSLIIEEIANTYTTSLGQTVYGGTLDVISGKLVIDRANITLNGTESGWDTYGSGDRLAFHKTISDKMAGRNTSLCDKYKNLETGDAYGSAGEGLFLVYSDHATLPRVYFRPPDSTVSALGDFKTWLASNPLTLVYELATPTTVQLTPTEIKTIIGRNNIWSNSGYVYTSISTENVTYKITGGAEDVQRLNKIWESILLYRNGGFTDKYRNLSGEGDGIIPHDPTVLKEE